MLMFDLAKVDFKKVVLFCFVVFLFSFTYKVLVLATTLGASSAGEKAGVSLDDGIERGLV